MEWLSFATNQMTGANAGERPGFAVKSRVIPRHRRGVAQLVRRHSEHYDINHVQHTYEDVKTVARSFRQRLVPRR